jgi:hypothetical protein
LVTSENLDSTRIEFISKKSIPVLIKKLYFTKFSKAESITQSFVGTWTGGPAGGFHLQKDGTFTGEGILDQISDLCSQR